MSYFSFAKITRLTRMVKTSFIYHQLRSLKSKNLKTISWTTRAEDSLETLHMKPLTTCFINITSIIHICFSNPSKILVLKFDAKSEHLKFCHHSYHQVFLYNVASHLKKVRQKNKGQRHLKSTTSLLTQFFK